MQQSTNNLHTRSLEFSKAIIRLLKGIHSNLYNNNIVSQVIRSSTSIGANYREASESESRADFIHKISLCKKEAKETEYWLQLLVTLNPEKSEAIVKLIDEANQLIKIFASSQISARRKSHSP